MGGQVELRLEPLSGRFDVHDDRWLDQVSGLVDELRAEVGDVATRRTPEPGTKGGIDALLIPVVSAGGLTAVVELVRSWLTRDPSGTRGRSRDSFRRQPKMCWPGVRILSGSLAALARWKKGNTAP